MNTSQSTERTVTVRKVPARRNGLESGAVLTSGLLEAFLERQRTKSTTEETVKRYRHALELLYDDLPPDKEVRRGTLSQWRESLLARGYAPRTVNVSISAANSLLAYLGRREFQLMERLEPEQEIRPELTRTEYLRLLSTARALGKEQLYLLVKVFGSTGLPVQALPKVTVEAARAGCVVLEQAGSRQSVHLPDCLRGELLEFSRRTGRRTGPVFVTGSGPPLGRTNGTDGIRKLCAAAQVPEEKGNPRCLRRLYQTTRAGIEANISLLVEQAHDRLVEKEQLDIGWEDGTSNKDDLNQLNHER